MNDDNMQAEGTAEQWRALGALALAELLGMTLWFSASAVAPASLRRESPERARPSLAGV